MPSFLWGADFAGCAYADYEEDWAKAARQNKLVVQHCTKCGNFQHTPRPFCGKCQTPWKEMEWKQVGGRGKIKAFTHNFRPLFPAWQERVPFTTVLVTIPDANNLMMLGNLINFKANPENPADPRLFGREVRAVFEDAGGDTTLIQWELV